MRLLSGLRATERLKSAYPLHEQVLLLHQRLQLLSLLRDMLLLLVKLVLVRNLLALELGLQPLQLLLHRSQIIEQILVRLGAAVVKYLDERLRLAAVRQGFLRLRACRDQVEQERRAALGRCRAADYAMLGCARFRCSGGRLRGLRLLDVGHLGLDALRLQFFTSGAVKLLHLLREILEEVLLLLLYLRHAPSRQRLFFSCQRQIFRFIAAMRLLDERVLLFDNVQELDAVFRRTRRNTLLLVLL